MLAVITVWFHIIFYWESINDLVRHIMFVVKWLKNDTIFCTFYKNTFQKGTSNRFLLANNLIFFCTLFKDMRNIIGNPKRIKSSFFNESEYR